MTSPLPLKIVVEDSRTCRPLDEALVHDGSHPYLSLMVNDSIVAGPEAHTYRVLSRRWSRGGLGEYHLRILVELDVMPETTVVQEPW
jgi:hypothetical protein